MNFCYQNFLNLKLQNIGNYVIYPHFNNVKIINKYFYSQNLNIFNNNNNISIINNNTFKPNY